MERLKTLGLGLLGGLDSILTRSNISNGLSELNPVPRLLINTFGWSFFLVFEILVFSGVGCFIYSCSKIKYKNLGYLAVYCMVGAVVVWNILVFTRI